MSFLASISAHVKKYLEAATRLVLKVKDRIPGYRHTVISLAATVAAVVAAVCGVESAEYVALANFLATLGIFKVKNRPDPVKRARKR